MKTRANPRTRLERFSERPDLIAAGVAIVAVACLLVIALHRPETTVVQGGVADTSTQDGDLDVATIEVHPPEDPAQEAHGDDRPDDRPPRTTKKIVLAGRAGPQVPDDNLATRCGLKAHDGASVIINADHVISRNDGELTWMTTKGTGRTFVFVEDEHGGWVQALGANGKRRAKRLIVVIPRDSGWKPPAQTATLFDSCDAFAAVADSAGNHSER